LTSEEDTFGRSRAVAEFEKLNRIGEGTYGIVYRARDTKSGKTRGTNFEIKICMYESRIFSSEGNEHHLQHY
jgi:serine/threonine protein kinase